MSDYPKCDACSHLWHGLPCQAASCNCGTAYENRNDT